MLDDQYTVFIAFLIFSGLFPEMSAGAWHCHLEPNFFFLNKVSIQIAVPVNCDRRWQFGALWVQLICKTAGSLTSAFPGSGSVRPGPWCCCKIQKGLEDASAWVEHQAKVWHWSVPKGKKCLLDVKNFSPAWCVDQSHDKK